MTPEELETVGKTLYGKRWQTDLARSLKLNPRTVRRYTHGEAIGKATREAIINLLAERLGIITGLLARFK
jgi:hypothetical protein